MMHEIMDLKLDEFDIHQLPQTQSFARPQAKKRNFACPQAIQLDLKAIFLFPIIFSTIPVIKFIEMSVVIWIPTKIQFRNKKDLQFRNKKDL